LASGLAQQPRTPITKTNDASEVAAGRSTTDTLVVTNIGPGEVSGVVVTDVAHRLVLRVPELPNR
jgi:hypothetical protein